MANIVSDEDWLRFCLFFNEQVEVYDCITEDLHYFRLKLNRCPATLNEMVDKINAAKKDDKWIMCSPEKGRFHMFGETGAYNIKFISSNNTDNIYEAVYDKDGKLITENDDNGKNMGTYNYASSSKDSTAHIKYDVDTYEDWGNTPLDPVPIKGSWNYNVTKKILYVFGSIEPRDKEQSDYTVDEDAKKHYIQVCKAIKIDYDKLLKVNFSDACY
ncbi:MAG TPA: hypothetical protein DEO82_06355 [Eubacterium sp.]|nr:hypothetical protein [Eubacterium sp.]